MSNSYLDRFRYKTGVATTNRSTVSDIIAASLSRIEVIVERLNKAIPIIFINNDKEGVDEAIIYSYNEDALVVGDYFNFSDNWYLVYKEQKNVKRENYIDSFQAAKCNINFTFNGSNVKAHYKGPLRQSGNPLETLSYNFGIDSASRALVIVPTSYGININDEFKINDMGYRVEAVDISTTPNITYLNMQLKNLVDTTKVSTNETTPWVPPVPPTTLTIAAGMTQIFNTEDAYIKSSSPLEILERKATTVKFIVPFGINTITIEVKKDGLPVSSEYKVV